MGKPVQDLTGQKFGRLTVIKRGQDYITPQGKNVSRWICKCDCGKENVLVIGASLKSGNTKSCGCYNKEVISGFEDLTGRNFGRLKVISFDVNKSNNKRKYWICKCECGNTKSILREHLINNKIQSCGCLQKEAMNDFNKSRISSSFAQWGIDNLRKDFLERYWDYEKNNINPYDLAKGNDKEYIWIKCQEKDYHKSYKTKCNNFINGRRCPFCARKKGKIHPLDSLGKILEDKGLLGLWSDKNNKSPYKYAPNGSQKVWWKCIDGKHDDFIRIINGSLNYNFHCIECVRERTESFLQEKVRLYLESLGYTILHEHNCTIAAINPKSKYLLPFDNEIKELKLIIEVHGEQHYKICTWHKDKANRYGTTAEYELFMQQVRDRYKRMYSKSKGYYYIEIPYWTNNIEEEWKLLIDNKIKQILKNN